MKKYSREIIGLPGYIGFDDEAMRFKWFNVTFEKLGQDKIRLRFIEVGNKYFKKSFTIQGRYEQPGEVLDLIALWVSYCYILEIVAEQVDVFSGITAVPIYSPEVDLGMIGVRTEIKIQATTEDNNPDETNDILFTITREIGDDKTYVNIGSDRMIVDKTIPDRMAEALGRWLKTEKDSERERFISGLPGYIKGTEGSGKIGGVEWKIEKAKVDDEEDADDGWKFYIKDTEEGVFEFYPTKRFFSQLSWIAEGMIEAISLFDWTIRRIKAIHNDIEIDLRIYGGHCLVLLIKYHDSDKPKKQYYDHVNFHVSGTLGNYKINVIRTIHEGAIMGSWILEKDNRDSWKQKLLTDLNL